MFIAGLPGRLGPSLVAPVLLMVGLLAAPPRARAFDVFCVSNGDGTSTCEGWRGGETLTCVGSSGGVSTCSVPSGRSFTCTPSRGGVSTCDDNPSNRPNDDGTECTFTGDGNFVCTPPRPRSKPLLPGPTLPPQRDPLRDPQSDPLRNRPLTPIKPVITNPSVF